MITKKMITNQKKSSTRILLKLKQRGRILLLDEFSTQVQMAEGSFKVNHNPPLTHTVTRITGLKRWNHRSERRVRCQAIIRIVCQHQSYQVQPRKRIDKFSISLLTPSLYDLEASTTSLKILHLQVQCHLSRIEALISTCMETKVIRAWVNLQLLLKTRGKEIKLYQILVVTVDLVTVVASIKTSKGATSTSVRTI